MSSCSLRSSMTITAQLAPASYTSPQQVQTTLVGCVDVRGDRRSTSRSFRKMNRSRKERQSTLRWSARVLSNGTPQNGQTVNFSLYHGSGTLNPASATTNSNGYASTTLQLVNFAAEVDGNACVGSNNNPCLGFHVFPVPSSGLLLQAVAGDLQLITVGSAFQPVVVRVTDTSVPRESCARRQRLVPIVARTHHR